MKTRVHFTLIMLATLVSCASCKGVDQGNWPSVKSMIRTRFPNVQAITTTELRKQLLDDSVTPKPLLLDTRSPAEYAVSHLQNALRAETNAEANAATRNAPRDRVIVVYCSVGFRSARIASWLDSRGFKNVYNLEGSIFEWANKGYPVYRGDTEVEAVHPYDAEWGRLLKTKYHRYAIP